MSEKDIKVKEKKSPLVRWGIYAVILLIVFLLGLVPMWIQKRAVDAELAASQKLLRKSEIKGLLTSSIVEAKRGEYENARKGSSDFFTRLRTEEETGDEGFLTEQERAKVKPIFDARDTVITMLAQRDPASLERLTNIYATYMQALGVAQPATTAPTTEATPAVSPAVSPEAVPE